MNVLEQERFSRLQFPVHKVKAQTAEELFEILPGLRRYFQTLRPIKVKIKNYTTGEELGTVDGKEDNYRGIYSDDLVKVIRFIVFMYDPDSDLLSEYPDEVRLRKEAAAKEAGFRRNKDSEWPQYVVDIFDLKEKQVVDWIIDYLKVKKNSVWTEIKFIEEEIDSLYRQRTTALLQGKVQADLMKLIKDRLEERDTLYKRFYAEHLDLKKVTQDELYPVTPENVFKELNIPPEVWKVTQIKDVLKAGSGVV